MVSGLDFFFGGGGASEVFKRLVHRNREAGTLGTESWNVCVQVKYSIVQQPNQKGTKFTVDEETGEIFTNKVFDREGDDGKFVSVTVKATDQGDPSLEGVCSFTVEITDVNDNPPLFDRQVFFSYLSSFQEIESSWTRIQPSNSKHDLVGKKK